MLMLPKQRLQKIAKEEEEVVEENNKVINFNPWYALCVSGLLGH